MCESDEMICWAPNETWINERVQGSHMQSLGLTKIRFLPTNDHHNLPVLCQAFPCFYCCCCFVRVVAKVIDWECHHAKTDKRLGGLVTRAPDVVIQSHHHIVFEHYKHHLLSIRTDRTVRLPPFWVPMNVFRPSSSYDRSRTLLPHNKSSNSCIKSRAVSLKRGRTFHGPAACDIIRIIKKRLSHP